MPRVRLEWRPANWVVGVVYKSHELEYFHEDSSWQMIVETRHHLWIHLLPVVRIHVVWHSGETHLSENESLRRICVLDDGAPYDEVVAS